MEEIYKKIIAALWQPVRVKTRGKRKYPLKKAGIDQYS